MVKNIDDINEIYEKINYAINNKNHIIKLYKEWKKKYLVEYKNCKNNFTKVCKD